MQSGSDVGERTLVSQLVKPGHILLGCDHPCGVAIVQESRVILGERYQEFPPSLEHAVKSV